jgi:hypothetical protein
MLLRPLHLLCPQIFLRLLYRNPSSSAVPSFHYNYYPPPFPVYRSQLPLHLSIRPSSMFIVLIFLSLYFLSISKIMLSASFYIYSSHIYYIYCSFHSLYLYFSILLQVHLLFTLPSTICSHQRLLFSLSSTYILPYSLSVSCIVPPSLNVCCSHLSYPLHR